MASKTIIIFCAFNFLAFTASTLVFPNSLKAVDECANCKANVTILAQFLAKEQIVNATIDSFHRDLCPYYSNDTAGCQKNVTAFWPLMAAALFTNTDVPINSCVGMQICNKTDSSKLLIRSK